MKFKPILLGAMLLAANLSAFSDSTPLATVGKTSIAPVLDGKLNDKCWRSSIEINNFIKFKSGGVPAFQDTKIYVTYDDKNLYLAFQCMEKILDPVLNQLHRFKAQSISAQSDTMNVFKDDSVEIFIAPDASAPSKYFHICVSASGVMYDSLGMAAPGKWNSNAKVKTFIGTKYWTAEISIPLNKLGDGKIVPGKTLWKANFCRNEKPEQETSSWSPASSRGFHDSSTFGDLRFVETGTGIRNISFPVKFQNGSNNLNATIINSSNKSLNVQVRLSAIFDNSDKVIFSDEHLSKAGKSSNLSVSYPVSSDNKCVSWQFASKGDPTETILRSKKLNFKPDTKYHFKALIKSDYSWTHKKPYNFFIIRQSGGGYKGITNVKVKRTSDGWETISGIWENGKITSGELWLLKWAKRNIKGKISVDNISLIDEKSGTELIHNGDFSKGPAGWSIFRKKSVKSGYGNGAEKLVLKYSILFDGEVVYSSPAFNFKILEENTTISSNFVNVGHDGIYQIEDVALAIGAPERLNLILKSSKNSLPKKVFCEIIIPEFCRMLNPENRDNSIAPSAISESIIKKSGKKFRRYLLTFSQDAVSSSMLGAWAYVSIPILLEAIGPLKAGLSGNVEYRAWFNKKEQEDRRHKLKLKVLPPLTGKQPDKLPLVLWAYPELYSFYSLSSQEQDQMIKKIALAGYNCVTLNSESLKQYSPYGIKGLGMLPTITITGNVYFPGVAEFLKKHPEHSAIYPNGKKALAIDPAYLLSDKCEFHAIMKKVISDHVEKFPRYTVWDYEFPFMPRNKGMNRRGAIGFSKKNLELFKNDCKIPVETQLNAATIYSKYHKQWIKFRCRQNAQVAGLYRRFVKRANQNCIFSFYSGYPPYAAKNYGVDWTSMTDYVDLAMCGYGGDNSLMMTEIKQKYYNAGVLLMSYVDQEPLQNTFGRYLALAGSYMGYIHFVVDGRYFYASSQMAAIATDFEKFFLNLKGNQKNYLTVGTGNKPRNDIKTIINGKERLMMIFNNSANKKRLSFSCKDVPAGFIGVDYDNKKVYKNLKNLSINLDSWQVKAFYVCSNLKLKQKIGRVPQPMRSYAAQYPVLRWKDADFKINRYELQYSRSSDFSNVVKNNITESLYQVDKNLTPGKWYWRVRAMRADSMISGSWSAPTTFHITLSKLLNWNKKVQLSPMDKLGYWVKVSWGGGGAISSLKKDYQFKHSGKYSLKIKNPYETTRSYWTNYRNSGGCTKLKLVRKGQKYQLSGYLKTEGEISSNLTIGFIDRDGKLMRFYRKSPIITNSMNWTKASVAVTVPDKAVALRVLFGGRGKGTAWCSSLKFEKLK